MCCDSSGYSENEINGECENCGVDTVDGCAYERCGYSPRECEVCDSRPCDGSC